MLLEIDNVVKDYRGGVRANDGISLSVDRGEVFGLLGPNGAGKTTLVSQIVALVAPTSGTIEIGGVDVAANPAHARKACSYQPQGDVPLDGFTPVQAIELVGRLRGGDSRNVRKRTQELIEALEISEWAHKGGSSLSGGVRRLVGYCMAVVTPGDIVILDEPTNDVDPLRRRLLWNHIRQLADSGTTVILVTHNVLEAERSMDRLAIIDKGRVQGTGTPASLKGNRANDLSPNPPKDTDGRREESGRGGEGATGEIAWVPFGVGRSADGLHRRTGAPMAVCGSCDAGDGERIRSRELSRTGLARVCGDLRLSGGWVADGAVRPGVEWLAAGPRRG